VPEATGRCPIILQAHDKTGKISIGRTCSERKLHGLLLSLTTVTSFLRAAANEELPAFYVWNPKVHYHMPSTIPY
jgi:hypothetical protein